MKIVAVIPARYESSRFPGKPLAELLGKPMILYVCEVAATALGKESVYVATDSPVIAKVVEMAGFRFVMTSASCLTGTDRVAEAAAKIDADVIVNIQGDEPMLAPESILMILAAKERCPGMVVNGMARISSDEDPHSVNLPKVVVSEDNRLIYMSRALLPASKSRGSIPDIAWKQVCIYAFEKRDLVAFAALQRKSFNERHEDIEILRFLDLGVRVQMIELPSSTLAVDVPSDVARVEAAMMRNRR